MFHPLRPLPQLCNIGAVSLPVHILSLIIPTLSSTEELVRELKLWKNLKAEGTTRLGIMMGLANEAELVSLAVR